jgi:selenocysteine lyase/cysteine desulfurase
LRSRRAAGTIEDMIGAQRELFDVPPEIAYFNTSNLSPLLKSVRAAGAEGVDIRGAPWNIKPIDWFTEADALRERAARVMGVDSDGVALVPASSYGLAVAARNLPVRSGERVIVLDDEFPSGFYTWQKHTTSSHAELVVVRRGPDQTWTEAVVRELDAGAAVVAVPNVHWTNGALLDLDRVAAATHAAGAALVIDASQSLGAMPLDVAALDPDFLVTVGYKWLLGPFSVGYLYVAPRHREGEPLEENWILRAGSDDFTSLTSYTDEYMPGARRFDVGERTKFELVPMANAALEQLLEWGVAGIAETLDAVIADIAERAAKLGLAAPRVRAPHMIGIELPQDSGQRVRAALRDAGVYAAVRGSSLRVSPHLHTTESDVDRLIDALRVGL